MTHATTIVIFLPSTRLNLALLTAVSSPELIRKSGRVGLTCKFQASPSLLDHCADVQSVRTACKVMRKATSMRFGDGSIYL